MRIFFGCILIILTLLITGSCDNPVYTPKPRMYPKVAYPDVKFINFAQGFCPFTFSYPDYWTFIKDTLFFGDKPKHECWFNMEMKIFNGSLHCSYYDIKNSEDLNKYLKDAFRMAREHQVKANYIDEIQIKKPGELYGMLYNIEGPSASPFQFYLTDSSKHFFRGSLYFNAQVRPDSLLPITEFVKKDLVQMLNSFEWK